MTSPQQALEQLRVHAGHDAGDERAQQWVDQLESYVHAGWAAANLMQTQRDQWKRFAFDNARPLTADEREELERYRSRPRVQEHPILEALDDVARDLDLSIAVNGERVRNIGRFLR